MIPIFRLTNRSLVILLTFFVAAMLLAWNGSDATSAQSTSPPSRLLPFSYYKLDEASGSNLTDSRANAPGSAIGTTIVGGRIGNARRLNGTQDYLNFGNISQFSNATKLTTSAWVNLSSTTGIQAFVTKWGSGGNTYWSDFSNGIPRCAFDVGAFITADITLQTNTWYHVVWVYNGTAPDNAARLRLFINGQSRTLDFANHNVPGSLPASTTPAQVGTYNSGANFFLNGIVDEIGLWSEAVTNNMVANLYNGGTGITFEQIQRADDLHRTSLVLLAHTHDFFAADLANAKAGGVTATTAKLTVDGIDWDRSTRTRFNLNLSLQAPEWRSNFLNYLNQVQAIADNPANGVMIIRTTDDILTAKANGRTGVILASEGANQLLGDLSKVQEYYDLGWRETQLRWALTNLLVSDNGSGGVLSDFGRQVIRKTNRLGIVIDVSHIGRDQQGNKAPLTNIIRMSTSPVMVSHDITPPNLNEMTDDMIRDVAQSGGGHGVFAVHFIVNNYQPPAILDSLLNAIDYLKQLPGVGINHIALGPDYMPEDFYSFIVPVTDLSDITLGLVRRGYTDDEIRKVLGQNLFELYRHVWSPAIQGAATLRLCTNNSSTPACLAATANIGEGDMSNRPINCRSATEQGVIGLQVSYVDGAWKYYSNIDLSLKPCVDGSALIASWTEPSGNARFTACSDGSTDPNCIAATTNGGEGTSTVRAVNCVNPQVNGIVGLQLRYDNGHWQYINAAGVPVQCAAGSTLVAQWGAATSNATFRLCENSTSDPLCANAAQGGGAGTSTTRVINCANSVGARGQVGLQLTYLNNQWLYYEKGGALTRCLEGSPLVINVSP